MDYMLIGQRIRKFRKARGLSQEVLAEQVNISTTHMSHIETGSTKLSLPVLVSIATVLEVSTDDILIEGRIDPRQAYSEIATVLDQCSLREARIIADLVINTKKSLEKNL